MPQTSNQFPEALLLQEQSQASLSHISLHSRKPLPWRNFFAGSCHLKNDKNLEVWRVCKSPWLLLQHHFPYQVLISEPGDLVLQAGFNARLWRQLQVLGQQLLLPIVFLLQTLDLASQGLQLVLVALLLRLKLRLQQPEEVEQQFVWTRSESYIPNSQRECKALAAAQEQLAMACKGKWKRQSTL